MNICKKKSFHDVQYFELGYGWGGKPLLTTHFYYVDGLLIDTAQSHMKKPFIQIIKNLHIDQVLLTHHHEDHSGNAAVVKKMKDVCVYGHSLTIEKLKRGFKILPYQHIVWGTAQPVKVDPLPHKIETDKYGLIPLHTPGHSKDHTAYLEKSQGWLFAGDLYLSSQIKFFRADEVFGDTLQSLRKVLRLDFDTLFCAHRPQLKNGKKKIQEKLNFLCDFQGQVHALHQKGCDIGSIKNQLSVKRGKKLMVYMSLGNVSLTHMIRSALQTQVSNLHYQFSPKISK